MKTDEETPVGSAVGQDHASGSGVPEFEMHPLWGHLPRREKPYLPGVWERQGVQVPRGHGQVL